MSVLNEFAERFGYSQSAWTKEQWKQVAIELASRLEGPSQTSAQRGRPRHDGARHVIDKDGNVTIPQKSIDASLAWQVQQRMEQAKAEGRSLKMKKAVHEELIEAIRRHNNAPDNLNRLRAAIGLPPLGPSDTRGKRDGEIAELRASDMLETAYTQVRKLLKSWSNDLETGSAGGQMDSQEANIREAIDNYSHPKGKPVNLRMRKRH